MDDKRKCALAREAAKSLAFLLVMLALAFLVMQGTDVTSTAQAQRNWLLAGVTLGGAAGLCWLYALFLERWCRTARVRNRYMSTTRR